MLKIDANRIDIEHRYEWKTAACAYVQSRRNKECGTGTEDGDAENLLPTHMNRDHLQLDERWLHCEFKI